jgi:crotonobetaine/carnitine-CoA ligase
MFDGYYGDPAESFACSRNWWFHTGDLGTVDDQGYYFFHGREKEAIRRGGENIAPEMIEQVANTHPAVAESAAVGVPDEILYEEIRLFARGRSGQRPDPVDLHHHCIRNLPKFMRPRYIDIVDELPKSASEKIQRMRLKERPLGEGTFDSRSAGRAGPS